MSVSASSTAACPTAAGTAAAISSPTRRTTSSFARCAASSAWSGHMTERAPVDTQQPLRPSLHLVRPRPQRAPYRRGPSSMVRRPQAAVGAVPEGDATMSSATDHVPGRAVQVGGPGGETGDNRERTRGAAGARAPAAPSRSIGSRGDLYWTPLRPDGRPHRRREGGIYVYTSRALAQDDWPGRPLARVRVRWSLVRR